MKRTVITTITTVVDVDKQTAEHSIEVECKKEFSQDLMLAAALGGARTAVIRLKSHSKKVNAIIDQSIDEESDDVEES